MAAPIRQQVAAIDKDQPVFDVKTMQEVRALSIAVYSMGGDPAAAADVTQQVFVKLMTRISQFRGTSEFTTWLYRLVVIGACAVRRRTSLPMS